jgi:hypothetical protein
MAFYAAPPYAPLTDRVLWTLRRYLVIGVSAATASLVLALGVSALTLAVYASEAAPSRARTFAGFYSHVSGAEYADPWAYADYIGPAPAGIVLAAPRERRMLSGPGYVDNVNLTFYDCEDQGFCGAMYNGRKVYQGAAACSWDMSLGTRFVIEGDPTKRTYVCEDRGLLEDTWVDVFWNDPRDGELWQSAVGRQGVIQIVAVP